MLFIDILNDVTKVYFRLKYLNARRIKIRLDYNLYYQNNIYRTIISLEISREK